MSSWIKMRSNLWDDPRVMKLCDITDQPEAMIIGGLYWLWANADAHTEDGFMPGLSTKRINIKTGIPGFAEALISIGWMAEYEDGVKLTKFDEHNGNSAKRRSQDAQRKSSVRNLSSSKNKNVPEMSALDADTLRSDCGGVAELEEDKSKNISTTTPSARNSSSVDNFEIFDDWQPSPQFPTSMQLAGIPEHLLNQANLVEFISYWKTRDSPERMTQAKWDHKFLQNLIKKKSMNGGASHEDGQGTTRKLTSHERLIAANAAVAARQG